MINKSNCLLINNTNILSKERVANENINF